MAESSSAKQDMIVRSIWIAAPIEKVFALASVPGWWLGPEDPSIFSIVERTGNETVLEHPKYGVFTFVTVGVEPPVRATFKWNAGEPDDSATAGQTVVEFLLETRDNGTEVTVEESGFAVLDLDEEAHLKAVEENSSGWEGELELLKRRAER